jgi:hypothetical protein
MRIALWPQCSEGEIITAVSQLTHLLGLLLTEFSGKVMIIWDPQTVTPFTQPNSEYADPSANFDSDDF